MRTTWYGGFALLICVPALMGFRACDSEVDVGGSVRDGGPAADGGQAPGYEPCADLTCGEQCTLCPPDDSDCVEPAVLNYCQPDGSCEPTTPECGPGAYDPCEGLTCGQECSQCPPDEPGCVEPAVVNYCHPDGSCGPTTPECVNCDHTQVACRALPPECDEGEVPSVEGTCWTFECVPAESCQRVRVRCEGASCLAAEPECAEGWSASVREGCWGPCVPDEWCTAYDPCEGLSCGESCSQCPPDDRECVEPAVLNYCQPDGSCHPTAPECPDDL